MPRAGLPTQPTGQSSSLPTRLPVEEGKSLCWGWMQPRGLPGFELLERVRSSGGGTVLGDCETSGSLPPHLVVESRDARLVWREAGVVFLALSRKHSMVHRQAALTHPVHAPRPRTLPTSPFAHTMASTAAALLPRTRYVAPGVTPVVIARHFSSPSEEVHLQPEPFTPQAAHTRPRSPMSSMRASPWSPSRTMPPCLAGRISFIVSLDRLNSPVMICMRSSTGASGGSVICRVVPAKVI